MKESLELPFLEEIKDPDREIEKRGNHTYVYDANMFHDKKRLMRWIYFLANDVGLK